MHRGVITPPIPDSKKKKYVSVLGLKVGLSSLQPPTEENLCVRRSPNVCKQPRENLRSPSLRP